LAEEVKEGEELFEMAQVPVDLSEQVRMQILKDMQPSLLTIFIKSGIAFTAGGILSLFICGQLGIGLDHAQKHFSHLTHQHAHGVITAVACGGLFALISPLVLRFLCSAIQFRIIIRKSRWIAILWLVALGGVLAHHDVMETNAPAFVLWCILAWLALEGLSLFIDWVAAKQLANYQIYVFLLLTF
jgi:hypothetical protein